MNSVTDKALLKQTNVPSIEIRVLKKSVEVKEFLFYSILKKNDAVGLVFHVQELRYMYVHCCV